MKRFVIATGLAAGLTLLTGPANAFISIGFGGGYAYPAYSYYYPAYAYPPPVYYAPPPVYYPPPAYYPPPVYYYSYPTYYSRPFLSFGLF